LVVFSLKEVKYEKYIKKNLFYTALGNTVFWIAGYCEQHSNNVEEHCKMLQEKLKHFCQITGVESSKVSSYEILESDRYKHMRVFYAEIDQAPKGAFELNKEWTMFSWIRC
jgi:hypothetical protein